MKPTAWRLLPHECATGRDNMALDQALMHSVAAGGRPILRYYGWCPAALSLGYAQSAADVRAEICRARGIDLVRRPTGGRAILHDDELTYAMIWPQGHPALPESVSDSYRAISEGMIEGLRSVGLAAELVPAGVAPETLGGARAACFAAASRCEVAVGGRKLIGSAQCRRLGVVLQHGSIPFTLDASALFDCLQAADGRARTTAAERFERSAVSLVEALGHRPERDALTQALTDGLAARLGFQFTSDAFTPDERIRAHALNLAEPPADQRRRRPSPAT